MGKQEILQDHKKTGKTFQPPFTHKLGPLHEISWVKTMIPELFWIAIIQDCYGHQMGVEIITAFSRIVCKCTEGSSDKKRVFASMSSFGRLTPEEGFCVRKELAASGRLFEIQKALTDLIAFYPQCPLCFLYSKIPSLDDGPEHKLASLKASLEKIYDKVSREAMMVQATAIWLAFDSDVLKVSAETSLAEFPEIEKYPHTELSQRVASSIRASLFMFFIEPHYPASSDWPAYFWNRGLEVDPCHF